MAVEIKYIVAGTYGEYNTWLMHKIRTDKHYPVEHCRYVDSVNMLRGLTACHGFFVGSYEQRQDIDLIRDAIRIVNTHRPQYHASSTPRGTSITGILIDEYAPVEDQAPVTSNSLTLGDLKVLNGEFHVWHGEDRGWAEARPEYVSSYKMLMNAVEDHTGDGLQDPVNR